MSEETFEFTPEEEADLEQRIAEIERGEYVTASTLFHELRAIRLRNDGPPRA
jgi:hypothetical protein